MTEPKLNMNGHWMVPYNFFFTKLRRHPRNNLMTYDCKPNTCTFVCRCVFCQLNRSP